MLSSQHRWQNEKFTLYIKQIITFCAFKNSQNSLQSTTWLCRRKTWRNSLCWAMPIWGNSLFIIQIGADKGFPAECKVENIHSVKSYFAMPVPAFPPLSLQCMLSNMSPPSWPRSHLKSCHLLTPPPCSWHLQQCVSPARRANMRGITAREYYLGSWWRPL